MPTGLQNLTGTQDLTLSYVMTTSSGSGAGINYVLGDKLVTAVPEPSTYALFGVGLVGLVLMRRRQSALRVS